MTRIQQILADKSLQKNSPLRDAFMICGNPPNPRHLRPCELT
jgi:hypothetical protein